MHLIVFKAQALSINFSNYYYFFRPSTDSVLKNTAKYKSNPESDNDKLVQSGKNKPENDSKENIDQDEDKGGGEMLENIMIAKKIKMKASKKRVTHTAFNKICAKLYDLQFFPS